MYPRQLLDITPIRRGAGSAPVGCGYVRRMPSKALSSAQGLRPPPTRPPPVGAGGGRGKAAPPTTTRGESAPVKVMAVYVCAVLSVPLLDKSVDSRVIRGDGEALRPSICKHGSRISASLRSCRCLSQNHLLRLFKFQFILVLRWLQ